MEILILALGLYDVIEGTIYIIGTFFSLTLLALSITAYRNTHLRKIMFAIIAFGLFAAFLFYEYLEHAFGPAFDTPYTDIIIPSMSLAILVLFFLAFVRKG
jgi:hypothetical protein